MTAGPPRRWSAAGCALPASLHHWWPQRRCPHMHKHAGDVHSRRAWARDETPLFQTIFCLGCMPPRCMCYTSASRASLLEAASTAECTLV